MKNWFWNRNFELQSVTIRHYCRRSQSRSHVRGALLNRSRFTSRYSRANSICLIAFVQCRSFCQELYEVRKMIVHALDSQIKASMTTTLPKNSAGDLTHRTLRDNDSPSSVLSLRTSFENYTCRSKALAYLNQLFEQTYGGRAGASPDWQRAELILLIRVSDPVMRCYPPHLECVLAPRAGGGSVFQGCSRAPPLRHSPNSTHHRQSCLNCCKMKGIKTDLQSRTWQETKSS